MEITRLILSAVVCVAVWQNFVQIRQHRKKQKEIEGYFKHVIMLNAKITCALFPSIIRDMVAIEDYREAEKCKKVLADAEAVLKVGVDNLKL
jgi:hypothetical protein